MEIKQPFEDEYVGTVTSISAGSVLNLSQTFNTTGTPTAVK